MKKYTLIVTTVLLFGAFNTSAQNTEKRENEKTEKTEKKEVKIKSKVTLKPAQPIKTVSTEKRVVQKALIQKRNVAPIRKEGDQ